MTTNRSVTQAECDDELLTLELQELNEAHFDLSLTGFDPKEIEDLLVAPEEDERANALTSAARELCIANATSPKMGSREPRP